MRCRQKTRKTKKKLSNIFSTIKLIESYFIENDSCAMQAKKPGKLKRKYKQSFKFSAIKLIELKPDTYAIQATNPQNRKKNYIIFFLLSK